MGSSPVSKQFLQYFERRNFFSRKISSLIKQVVVLNTGENRSPGAIESSLTIVSGAFYKIRNE
jgi:hypothetical protein